MASAVNLSASQELLKVESQASAAPKAAASPSDEKTSSLFRSFLAVATVALAVIGGASLVSDMGARDLIVLAASAVTGPVKACVNFGMEYIVKPGMDFASTGFSKVTSYASSFSMPKFA